MRAVIFAALLAGTSTWFLITDWPARVAGARPAEPEQSLASLRSRYRAENTACKAVAEDERAACQRRARNGFHAGVRREAAQLSLR